MKKNWNDQSLKDYYEQLIRIAQREGFSEPELEYPYLDVLSHKTKSERIMNMIRLAYTLGQLRAAQDIDELKSKITPSFIKAKWAIDSDGHYCTACKEYVESPPDGYIINHKYCPNCGAEMSVR